MINDLGDKMQSLATEERLNLLVGYIELARREIDHMIRNSEMAGDDEKAAGIEAGYQLIGDFVHEWYADIAEDIEDSVDMAHALHRARMGRDLPF